MWCPSIVRRPEWGSEDAESDEKQSTIINKKKTSLTETIRFTLTENFYESNKQTLMSHQVLRNI